MFHLPTLVPAFFFALAVWFAAHSAAAIFTLSEPDIGAGDRDHRFKQAIHLGLIALVFTVLFHATL